MITLYTTHCPRCKILEAKLKKANINYSICEDMNKIIELGYKTVPILVVDNNPPFLFKEACDWVNSQE